MREHAFFTSDLSVSEFNIVRMLVCKAGNHVTYRAIYDCIHYAGFVAGSGEHGYRRNVRSNIKRIRIKFHACDPDFDEIANYVAVGYRWKKPA